MSRPYAPACDRNREPILAIIRDLLPATGKVLELGSGSGQHAAYFSAALPLLEWLPSDLPECLPGIEAWRDDAGENCLEPIAIDLLSRELELPIVDAIVCINTVHIMAWQGTVNLFAAARDALTDGGIIYLYGPYRYRDQSLAESNVRFDEWLKGRDSESGIREFEQVSVLAEKNGFELTADLPMPANNRSLCFMRRN